MRLKPDGCIGNSDFSTEAPTDMYKKITIKSFPAMLGLLSAVVAGQAGAQAETKAYIVEADRTVAAARAVRQVGGRVTNELPIVNGVSALLSPGQAARLRKNAHLQLFADSPVSAQTSTSTTISATSNVPDIYQRAMIGVNELAAQGINGAGVTVAVLDSGILQNANPSYIADDLNGNNRVVAQFDATNNVLVDAFHHCASPPCVNDTYGHGTHIASLIASADTADAVLDGQPLGVAPMVRLITSRHSTAPGAAATRPCSTD